MKADGGSHAHLIVKLNIFLKHYFLNLRNVGFVHYQEVVDCPGERGGDEGDGGGGVDGQVDGVGAVQLVRREVVFHVAVGSVAGSVVGDKGVSGVGGLLVPLQLEEQ